MKNICLKLVSLSLVLMMLICSFAACDKDTVGGNDGKDTEQSTDNSTTEAATTEAPIITTSVKLADFTIVHADDEISTAAAEKLKALIAEKAKVTLEITNKYEQSDSYKILVGDLGLDITKDFFAKKEDDTFKIYDLKISGRLIALAAANRIAAESACSDFVELFVKADTDTIEIADALSYEGNVYGHEEIFIEERIDNTDIRIATFNIANYMDISSRLQNFKKLFDLFDADVIMLQEMSGKQGSTLHTRLGLILQKLGYVQVPPNVTGKNKADDPNPIYYRKDRLKLLSSELRVYADTSIDTRMYTVAEFTDTVTGKSFSCISTHASVTNEARIVHAEELKTFITEYQSTRTSPLFLMGDLNCLKGRAPLSTTIASFMTHATDMTGIVTRNMEYGTSSNGQRWPAKDKNIIDHAFGYGAGYSGKQYQIVASQLAADTSDHLPLIFDFALN